MKDVCKSKKGRPLSPHLSIYKPQISSILSIGHRISGAGLFLMLLFFCWYFIFWVFSGFEESYGFIFDYKIIKTIIFITSYGYFYHLCMGIRHLIWDTGFGFSICALHIGGWIALACSVMFTLCFWTIILI